MVGRIEGVRIGKESELGGLARRLYGIAKETEDGTIKLDSLNVRGLRWASIINYYLGINLKEPILIATAFYHGIRDGRYAFDFIKEEFFNQTDLRKIWEQVEITLILDIGRNDTKSPYKKRYKDPAPRINPNRYKQYMPRVFKDRRRG